MIIQKKSKMFLGLSIGTRRMKKTGGDKSRGTVPIRRRVQENAVVNGGGWDS
jgi:hypothetical protein